MISGSIIWSLEEAERLAGGPVSVAEVTVVYLHNYSGLIVNQGYMSAFLQTLYREDRFYANKPFSAYSMTGDDESKGKQGFERFSERFHRIYPGYLLDNK